MIFAIGIGSNLGNRLQNIIDVINLIEQSGIVIIKKSVIYQNKAWIPDDVDEKSKYDIDFFNAAILCENGDFEPFTILNILKNIERKLEGKEKTTWSPRIIDLDLLFFDNLTIQNEKLILPHNGLIERPFVLLPLLQISPKWIHPIYQKSISQICQEKQFSAKNGDFIKILPLNSPKIMGIVNITPDSTSSDGYLSRNDKNNFSSEIWQKFLDGASILDFGAQSTRPHSTVIDYQEEIERMKIVMDDFFASYFNKSPIFPEISIDSFYPEVINHCITNYHVDIVNDVSGLADLRLLDYIANSDRKIVLMHNLGIPAGGKIFDESCDVMDELKRWFEEKIEQIMKFSGIKKEQIILDPGMGFGKTITQQYELINRIGELKEFGLKILLGHSKKSFMRNIASSENRANETIAISSMVTKNVDYLRVHDVKNHVEILAANEYCNSI